MYEIILLNIKIYEKRYELCANLYVICKTKLNRLLIAVMVMTKLSYRVMRTSGVHVITQIM